MNPNLAQQLFEEFSTIVVLGMPPGTEFGIDMKSWNVGEKFRGVKMIPPGLHFIYYSAVSNQGDTAPRTGFFHYFKRKELIVRHYDVAMEDLKDEDEDPGEVGRLQSNLRQLDQYLGAYPAETWEKWVSLTQHITEKDLERMIPLSGKICSAPELVVVKSASSNELNSDIKTDMKTSLAVSPHKQSDVKSDMNVSVDASMSSDTDTNMQKDPADMNIKSCKSLDKSVGTSKVDTETISISSEPAKNIVPELPNMVPRPGTELRFSKFPSRPYREGATPSEITHYSLDSSYSLRKVIENLDKSESLLAELQLSFVCFLVGQVWDGWEQWRKLLGMICSAEELLVQEPQTYLKLLSLIHFQIQEVPEDLFVDIVESNNFLAAALKTLFANISDNAALLPNMLVSKALRFKNHITTKFSWNLTLEDEGEDAPVVVETEDVT
ncbi:a1-alpha2 repression [Halocaridina rubra]|uniref:Protein AAR2 homolog n=1 Tax=Halocaridina rubra TaxID=373956 RepID=A0AAN8WMC4_HALRR